MKFKGCCIFWFCSIVFTSGFSRHAGWGRFFMGYPQVSQLVFPSFVLNEYGQRKMECNQVYKAQLSLKYLPG
jgi:hypothetical protein